MKLLAPILLLIMTSVGSRAQIYTKSFAREAGIFAPGLLTMGTSIMLKKKHHVLTPADLEVLRPESIGKVDRWVTSNWNEHSHQISNGFLFSSYGLPFGFLADRQGRKEFGNIGLFTIEALLLNNGIGNLTKYLTHRVRPFVYNPHAPESKKFKPNANLSFFSGHTSNVSCMYFLTASIYDDLYPNSSASTAIWSLAAIIPAVQGYLRVRAGKHFVTDVVVGYLVGAAVGFAVPALHR